MAADPEQKRRIIAQQLFPDLGPQAAQARIFYGPNGRMAAVGMDGQPYMSIQTDPTSRRCGRSPRPIWSQMSALWLALRCRPLVALALGPLPDLRA